MTVSDLKKRMSVKEFEYWKVYYNVKAKLEADAIEKAKRKK